MFPERLKNQTLLVAVNEKKKNTNATNNLTLLLYYLDKKLALFSVMNV